MVNGIVWVIDYSGLGLDHIKHRSLDNMRKWLRSWQVITVTGADPRGSENAPPPSGPVTDSKHI